MTQTSFGTWRWSPCYYMPRYRPYHVAHLFSSFIQDIYSQLWQQNSCVWDVKSMRITYYDIVMWYCCDYWPIITCIFNIYVQTFSAEAISKIYSDTEVCGFSIIQQLTWQACYVTLDLCTQLHCYSYRKDFCLCSILLCHFLKAQSPITISKDIMCFEICDSLMLFDDFREQHFSKHHSKITVALYPYN